MKAFMDEDFLLQNGTARRLYHDVAQKMPIIDYHCHINPREIAENRRFTNITEVWLGGDHYKWRLMRANGAPEEAITGAASDKDKFMAFAKALPRAIGNPLYHWTHLELKRYFGYDKPLSPETAEEIWNLCNEQLQSDSLSVRGILSKSNVRVIATTDDPADSLEWHRKIQEDKSFQTKVVPAFRPDKAYQIDSPDFPGYISTLSKACGCSIGSFKELCAALETRMDIFDALGCRACDHGLFRVVYERIPENEIDEAIGQALSGKAVTKRQADGYGAALLLFLGRSYAKRGWVMQLHYGALRNANTRLFEQLGPDTGFDCIGPGGDAKAITAFLDALNREGCLPRTILYSLNPNDDAMLDTIIGCFQQPGVPGWVQHGSAWWFNDTMPGMQDQLRSLASRSLLGSFVGMLTDSRSFLSYTRHEYFRRILCNMLGTWVENGEYPNDWQALQSLVEDISYNNAQRYFRF